MAFSTGVGPKQLIKLTGLPTGGLSLDSSDQILGELDHGTPGLVVMLPLAGFDQRPADSDNTESE